MKTQTAYRKQNSLYLGLPFAALKMERTICGFQSVFGPHVPGLHAFFEGESSEKPMLHLTLGSL